MAMSKEPRNEEWLSKESNNSADRQLSSNYSTPYVCTSPRQSCNQHSQYLTVQTTSTIH